MHKNSKVQYTQHQYSYVTDEEDDAEDPDDQDPVTDDDEYDSDDASESDYPTGVWTYEKEYQLAKLWRKYKFLYDQSLYDYRDPKVKNQTWHRIATKLDIPCMCPPDQIFVTFFARN